MASSRGLLVALALFPAAALAQFPFNIGGESLDQGFAIAATPYEDWSNYFMVVTGEFRQSADFDPGPDEYFLTANGTRDAFVARYSLYGYLEWAFNLGGPGVDGGHGVALDDDANVYVVGTFRQSVDFDPGDEAHVITSNGETDAFLASYTADGAFRWAFNIGGDGFDQGHAVTVTPFGSVCATGSFREIVDFDPGEGEAVFTSAGSYDIWVACYTLDEGELVWAYGTGGPGDFDRGWGIASDEGGVYLTGDFTGTTQFDPAGEAEPLTALGPNDIFVASYGPAGAFRWAYRAGSPSNEIGDRGNAIAVVRHGGMPFVYVTGDFVGTADFPDGSVHTSAGGRDAFVMLFQTSGQPFSSFPISSPGDNRGTGVSGLGEAANFEVAVVTGYFEGTIDLDPTGGHAVTSPGGRSFFVATYEYGGLWEGLAVGGPLNDQAYGVAGHYDAAHVIGSFRGTVDFQPGVLTANGPIDAFVARYHFPIPLTPSTEAGPGSNAPTLRLAGANPSVGGAAVRVTVAVPQVVVVDVLDVLGRRVAVVYEGALVTGQEQIVAVPSLPAGLYVVRALGAGGAASLRISSLGG